jgi:hypothetical protein
MKRLLLAVSLALVAAAFADVRKSVTFHWEYPAEELTNVLAFKLYSSTDISVPLTNWTVLTNIVGTVTNITIPIAALDGLTSAEAHTSTGDWRSIMLAICSTAYRHYSELDVADRPVMFTATMPTMMPAVPATNLRNTRPTIAPVDFSMVISLVTNG